MTEDSHETGGLTFPRENAVPFSVKKEKHFSIAIFYFYILAPFTPSYIHIGSLQEHVHVFQNNHTNYRI